MVKNRCSNIGAWDPEKIRSQRQGEEGNQQWKLRGICGEVENELRMKSWKPFLPL